MASYARRTCSECGIQRQQPAMFEIEVQPIGVNGNALARRLKWFCGACAQRIFEKERQEARQRREEEQRPTIEAERQYYKDRKKAWAQEQEVRRLKNLVKRQEPHN